MKNSTTLVSLSKHTLLISYLSGLKIFTNKIMIVCVFTLFFSNLYSQENYIKLPGTKNNCLIVIINNDIISNENFINHEEKSITQMSVMKGKPNRKEHKFYNLSENGIVLVSIDKKIKSKSQQELNRFFGINKKNQIYVNGYLIENSDYKIATENGACLSQFYK